MPTLILTCKKNKKYAQSLLDALNERGLGDISLESKETAAELCHILKDDSYFDTLIFLGEAELLKEISTTLSIPLKASSKAISKIESYCTAIKEDPLKFRENVLILNGSAPILQNEIYCGCAIPVKERLLIYLPLVLDETGIEKTAKLLSSHSPESVDIKKQQAFLLKQTEKNIEQCEEIPSEASGIKFKCSKITLTAMLFVLTLCFAGISIGLYSIAAGGNYLPAEDKEEISTEEPVVPITFEQAAKEISLSFERMSNSENERQNILKTQYEDEKNVLLEAENVRQQELEAKKLEEQKLEGQKLEQQRLEQQRIEQQKLEQQRLEQQRLEQQKLEQQKLEQQRLEQQKLEQQRLEQQRLEQQRLEQQRLEQQRLENERLEKERLEQERLEQERLEKEEQERLEQERLEQERLEQEEQAEKENNSSFMGDEELYATINGKVKAIDSYDLMLYAVQNETQGNMHPEALKAQAVASYTFFKYNNIHGVSPALNTNLNISKSTRNAVDAVFGEALYYNGSYINAVYHSTSCGETASAQDVWGTHLPYLVSVDSSWDEKAPRFNTVVSIKAHDFQKAVENTYGIHLEDGDEENWIYVETNDDGGYAGTVSLGGSTVSQGGSFGRGRKITGRSIREQLLGFKIRSHCFDVSYDFDNDRFIFDVRGYGHGVGMSQYGAQFMAQDGYTYDEILSHYYVGAVIK